MEGNVHNATWFTVSCVVVVFTIYIVNTTTTPTRTKNSQ
jgi:hypothetical protein